MIQINWESTIFFMGNGIDLENLDFLKFARSIERDCQEGVKWQRRKHEWLHEEEAQKNEGKSEAA